MGISYADSRINKNSASYSAGITFADSRVNTSSSSYNSGFNNGVASAQNFTKIHTFTNSTKEIDTCSVPSDAVLYKNLFVCFMGGTVNEDYPGSTQHTLSIQNISVQNSTLTIDTYYPCNNPSTVRWSADVWYAE